MPHVQLRTMSNGDPQLLVDGVDMTNSVASSGFSIDQPNAMRPRFRVRLELMPATADIDLPEAFVQLMGAADAPNNLVCNAPGTHLAPCDCANGSRA